MTELDLRAKIRDSAARIDKLRSEIQRVIIGQEHMVNSLLIGLLTDGHVLIEGVPGLAKTKTILTLSQVLDLAFKRIQFTPDLLPADLVGTMIYNQGDGKFYPHKGPVFTNILLADEINRAPAKVQSALLEVMQERQVTISDSTYQVPEPFFVLATQNPIEQEGTYPLPEAQVDRFMLKITITYPTQEQELGILSRMEKSDDIAVESVLTAQDILAMKELVKEIYVEEKLKKYIVDIVCCTRKPSAYGLDMDHLIEYGASPRASIYITRAAKANAFLQERYYITPEDIKEVGLDVLRHRVILSYEAEAEEKTTDALIRDVFNHIEVP